MSAMQVLVQEKTVHHQQIVLTSKGPQRHTHLTSIFQLKLNVPCFSSRFEPQNIPSIVFILYFDLKLGENAV